MVKTVSFYSKEWKFYLCLPSLFWQLLNNFKFHSTKYMCGFLAF
jgi:hypothetical protein